MRMPSFVSAHLPSCLYLAYRALCAVVNFREEGRERVDALNAQGERMVFCLWHDELFPTPHIARQLDIVAVVSPSRDGDLLAGVLTKFGLRTARGSSSRGGSKALLDAAHLMKSGTIHACFTVDGPRGPRHQAKTGALFLAQHTNAYIVPLRCLYSRSFQTGSWDRLQIPLPFSRVLVRFGPPWKPEANPDLAAAKERLENDLLSLNGRNAA